MFTGIIECVGELKDIATDKENVVFTVASPISHELKEDQSVTHNGACLTVTGISGGTHQVVAVRETLLKTNLGKLKVGDRLNLERSMLMNGRFDGHIVQGHVDQTGVCTSAVEEGGSWRYKISHKENPDHFTVEKGSVCINGVSLTVVNASKTGFEVAIIPYTYEHTNFKNLTEGDQVNLEFDIIGKYLQQLFLQYKQ